MPDVRAAEGTAQEERKMAKNVSSKKPKRGDAKRTGAEVKSDVHKGSLASSIDPMLLAGGMTVKEIAAELAGRAAEAAKDKDLAANIRARMVAYTRKGWQVIKDDEKRVKLLQMKG